MPSLTEVPVPATSPEAFEEILGPDFASLAEAVETAERLLTGRVIWHINSTARGGGVAEMLASLLAYARGAGADVRWLTISGDPEFFRITKRLHNRLHEADGDGGPLGERERRVYEGALLESAEELVGLVRPGDIVYIHDPQPAGLIPHVKTREINVVWRCHVGADHPGKLAETAWHFLRPYVEDADAYVFSRREFVWRNLDDKRLWIVPPSIDVFSPKNQDLDPGVVRSIIATIGLTRGDDGAAVFKRHDGSAGRVDRPAEIDQDAPLPMDAPLVAQVSRWDRLKDPLGVLKAFAEHVGSREAHLALVGPSTAAVADDPEGAEVIDEVRAARNDLPAEIRERVHLVSLPMDDVEENAAMVNAIQRRADVIVQKSLAEGFGLTIAEGMWKAKPVVASAVGGIQDQVVDGESGLLFDDPADLRACGEAIGSLLADPARAAKMGEAARERVRKQFLGSRHLVQYMQLIGEMLATQAKQLEALDRPLRVPADRPPAA